MNKRKILSLLCVFIMLFSLTSCFNSKEPEDNSTIISTTLPTNYTLADLKSEFPSTALSFSTGNYAFKPFYNVENTTEFTFHFKSAVDPIKAITVHTDSKCEENSTVFQWNDGYRTENGVDVIVKPKDPVLDSSDRTDHDKQTDKWGYAPIYYLCLRYDLDSTTPKKLENPIIIPFTIKNEISTPNAYANVDSKGNFSIKWNPVKDAKSYRIYQSEPTSNTSGARDYTRAECGYVGDFLKLTATVDANTTSFSDFDPTNENSLINLINSSNGYVSFQNTFPLANFYVTAIDSNGNESFFSQAISSWKYRDSLPYRVESQAFDRNDKLYLEKFSDSIAVTMTDNKTTVFYPINYYKLQEATYQNTCTYRYEIVGTELTGEITYYSEARDFPETVLSKSQPKALTLPVETAIDIIPSTDVDTFSDPAYQNVAIDLASKVTYPKEAKIQLDLAILAIRTNLEAARFFSEGIYTKSLDTISSYLTSENPEYIIKFLEDGSFIVEKAPDTVPNLSNPEENKVPDLPKPEENKVPDLPKSEENKVPDLPKPEENKVPDLSKPEENKVPDLSKPEENKVPDLPKTDEPPAKIDNINYVEEQKKSTEKQVKEADKEQITPTSYPIFAQTPEEKYLALQIINHEPVISVKGFPSLQNFENLLDTLLYVYYQNPYILDLNINETYYDTTSQSLVMAYTMSADTVKREQEEIYQKSNQVIQQIIKPNMTSYEKVIAIWDYLENNSTYETAALDYAEKHNYSMEGSTGFENTFNTYGILCKGLGVCQSYAYTFKLLAHLCDIDAVVVTGSAGNVGHAWNAIKIDGKWYMIDTTNNSKNSGIPYWVFQSSSDFIHQLSYTLDDFFVIGTSTLAFQNSDSKQDYYYVNNLFPSNATECADILVKEWIANKDKRNTRICIKYTPTQAELETILNSFVQQVLQKGYTSNDLENWSIFYGSGMMRIETKS